MYVYPSLPRHVASELYEELTERRPETLREQASTEHRSAVYYSTGTRVGNARIVEVARRVRECVDALGFPEPTRARESHGTFDRIVPRLLFETMEIVPADAGAEGVWSFLSLVVLPDIVVWRYPGRARERLLGLPRNAFRRLWWRAYVLGCGESDPTQLLGEDQLVAVMERPTIGGNPRLASAFCNAVIDALAKDPKLPSMFLMREAAKRLTRLTPFVCFGALTAEDLERRMKEIVVQASQTLERDVDGAAEANLS